MEPEETDYLEQIKIWAERFEKSRYIPTEKEIEAMHSDLFFDLINNENHLD